MSDNDSVDLTDPNDDNELESPKLAPTLVSKHPILMYSLARLGILAGCLAAVYLFGARGIIWILISFVISALLSYLLLGRLRDQISAGVGNHFDKLNDQVEDQDQADVPDSSAADEQPNGK